MTQINLNPVRYYDITDIYVYETDNRPIYDVNSNINLINNSLSNLGYYQNLQANSETEPPGGFSPMTVAYVGNNSLLYPIDITLSPITIDYSLYPIYLITANNGNSNYDCLAFSATYSINNSYVNFLPTSIGHALKVGPGGTLVDEIYFDLYYSDQQYQNIIVGKVLTATAISFGGNQVNILSDNNFISKNRNDSSTGTLTTYVDNSATTVANRFVLINNLTSNYPFMEFNAYVGTTNILGTPQPVPIYFSNIGLSTDPITGDFTESNLVSLLNEIHFGAPTVISGSAYDPKYSTAGVNIGTLTDYAGTFLLHNSALSNLLQEYNQTLGTFLTIDNSVNTSASLLLPSINNDSPSTPGTGFGHTFSTNGLPVYYYSAIATIASGIQFGPYASGTGGFLGYVQDTTQLLSTEITSLTSGDTTTLAYAYGETLVNMAGGNHIVLNNINANSNAGVFITADYIVITPNQSAVLNTTITSSSLATSLVNKNYVDTTVTAIAATANSKIPLAGNDSTTPVSGTIFFDLTKSATDPSTVLDCTTIGTTFIKSTNTVQFIVSGTSEAFQAVQALTPAPPSWYVSGAPLTDTAGSPNDVVTRAWINALVTTIESSSAGSAILANTQTFTGTNTFSSPIILTGSGATASLSLQPAIGSIPSFITASTDTIDFVSSSDGITKIKLDIATPLSTDPVSTAATKGYVDSAISGSAPIALCYASWWWQTTNSAVKLTIAGPDFQTSQPNQYYYSCIPVPSPDDYNPVAFASYFNWNSGYLTYTGATPTVFTVSCQDGRPLGPGYYSPGSHFIYQTQTKIAVQRNGSSTVNVIAVGLCRTDGNGSTEVASNCSTVVSLNTGDILFIGSENSDHVSASLVQNR